MRYVAFYSQSFIILTMGLIVPGAATAPGRERGSGGTCDSVASYMNYAALYSLSCNILSVGFAESGAAQCSALCHDCHDETHAAFARHTVSLCSSVTKGTEVVQCLWNCYAGCVPMGIANPPRLRAVVPRRLLPRLMDAGPQTANIREKGIRQVVPRSLRAEVVLEGANLHSIP